MKLILFFAFLVVLGLAAAQPAAQESQKDGRFWGGWWKDGARGGRANGGLLEDGARDARFLGLGWGGGWGSGYGWGGYGYPGWGGYYWG